MHDVEMHESRNSPTDNDWSGLGPAGSTSVDDPMFGAVEPGPRGEAESLLEQEGVQEQQVSEVCTFGHIFSIDSYRNTYFAAFSS